MSACTKKAYKAKRIIIRTRLRKDISIPKRMLTFSGLKSKDKVAQHFSSARFSKHTCLYFCGIVRANLKHTLTCSMQLSSQAWMTGELRGSRLLLLSSMERTVSLIILEPCTTIHFLSGRFEQSFFLVFRIKKSIGEQEHYLRRPPCINRVMKK